MGVAWYVGNTFYNIYNKKASNMIHAHWFLAAAQLVVGIVISAVLWGTGIRKMPNLSSNDIASCIPIGLFACLAHGGSALAAAVVVIIPPADIKPFLAYLMLIPIVGGVGL